MNLMRGGSVHRALIGLAMLMSGIAGVYVGAQIDVSSIGLGLGSLAVVCAGAAVAALGGIMVGDAIAEEAS